MTMCCFYHKIDHCNRLIYRSSTNNIANKLHYIALHLLLHFINRNLSFSLHSTPNDECGDVVDIRVG